MGRRYIVELTEKELDALEYLLIPVTQSPEDYTKGIPATCDRILGKLRAATDQSRPGRPRLTRRILDAILDSLRIHEAGGPEDMTGYNDAASKKRHAAVGDAYAWAVRASTWMDAGGKR